MSGFCEQGDTHSRCLNLGNFFAGCGYTVLASDETLYSMESISMMHHTGRMCGASE